MQSATLSYYLAADIGYRGYADARGIVPDRSKSPHHRRPGHGFSTWRRIISPCIPGSGVDWSVIDVAVTWLFCELTSYPGIFADAFSLLTSLYERGYCLARIGMRLLPERQACADDPLINSSYRRKPDKSAQRVERLRVGPKGARSEPSMLLNFLDPGFRRDAEK